MSSEITLSHRERLRFFKEPGPRKVYEWLKRANPQGQWSLSGQKINGLCPYHADRSPSSVLNLDRGFFSCSSCNTYVTDFVRFAAHILNTDYKDAFDRTIIQEFSLKVEKTLQLDLARDANNQEVLKVFCAVSSELLIQAANNPSDEAMRPYQGAVQELFRRRINIAEAAVLGVGVCPPAKDVWQRLPVEMRRHMTTAFEPDTFAPEVVGAKGTYEGWLTFPYYTAPDKLGRIKLREPNSRTKRMAWLGTGSDDGFFGLNHYPTLVGQGNTHKCARTVYIVEGEYDALSSRIEQSRTGVDVIIVGGSGGGVSGVSSLHHFGFDTVVAVGDNDRGGKQFTRRILGMVPEIKGFQAKAFVYPDTFTRGCDPDDLVHSGSFPALRAALQDPEQVLESYRWCVAQVLEEAAVPGVDLVQKMDIAREYLQIVHEGIFRSAYIEEIAGPLQLSPEHLYKEIASIETEEGFINALNREMEKLFEPLAVQPGNTVLCFNRKTKRLFSLPMKQKRDVVSTLHSACFGTDCYTWVSLTLGIPEFIQVDTRSKNLERRLIRIQQEDIETYIFRAADTLCAEKARPVERFEVRRQGAHYFDASKDHVDMAEMLNALPVSVRTPENLDPSTGLPASLRPKRIVVVNGLNVYVGEFTGDERIDYRTIDCPVNSKYLLETSDKGEWSANIRSVEDLNRPIAYDDAKKAIDDVMLMIKTGWKTSSPETVSMFLASFMFMLPIAMMTEAFPLVGLFGSTQAGKSSLLKGMMLGEQGIGVVEHARGFDDYTMAGLMQASAGSSLLVCADEFEDADDNTAGRKSNIVQNILETWRNIATGVSQTRGTQSGHNREEFLRYPVCLSAIHKFKKEEDINRYVTVDLERQPAGSAPPALRVRSLFPDASRFEEIRRVFTLYPLQNAPLFQRLAQEVYVEVFDINTGIKCKETRFLRSLIMVMAVLKHFGYDYMAYGRHHVSMHEESLSLSVLSEEERLFRAVFYTKGVVLEQDNGIRRTVMEVLADPELREKLGGSNCGVFHVPGKDFVVLYPYGITSSILTHHVTYKGTQNPHTIYQRLARHPDVWEGRPETVGDPAVRRYLAQFIGNRIPAAELLVVKLDALLSNPDADDTVDVLKGMI